MRELKQGVSSETLKLKFMLKTRIKTPQNNQSDERKFQEGENRKLISF